MSEELKIIANEDGTFSEYDDTFDITIHCQSEEEQNEVLAKLNAPPPKMGKWIDEDVYGTSCSECGKWYPHSSLTKQEVLYCCKCGAKMQEVEE